MIPSQRLREIREREQRATKGSWKTLTGMFVGRFNNICTVEDERYVAATKESKRDAFSDQFFIAHARSDIPFLLARVEELESVLRKIAKREAYVSVPNILDKERDAELIYRMELADAALSAGREGEKEEGK